MSKKIIGIIIGVAVLLIGVGAFAYTQLNKPQVITPQNVQVKEKTQEESIVKGSIKSLLGSGKNTTCTMNYPDGKGSGVIYATTSKVRADITTKVESKVMLTHMIQDGEYLYMWEDTTNQGTKIKIDPSLSAEATKSGKTDPTSNLDEELDLKCSSWSVDSSKFEVPTTVKFTDLSSITKPKTSGGNTLGIDKSICDQIQDPDSKASCLKALGN